MSDKLVCIRDKSDIGVARSITYGGVQYTITKPHGALDPQPSPAIAAEMVRKSTFCYVGFEADVVDPTAKIEARIGPPTLEELRERRTAQTPAGAVDATGIMKDVAERGRAQAAAVIEGQVNAHKALAKALADLRPPTLEELREEEAAPPSPDAGAAPTTTFDESVLEEQRVLAALAEVSEVGSSMEADTLEADLFDDGLDALSDSALRKKGRDSNINGWKEMSRQKLIKALRRV